MTLQTYSALSSKVVLATAFLCVSFGTSLGQAAARPDRGTMPSGSYSASDIENISLTNGNVNIGIPLASLPPVAGGKLGLALRAAYNSKPWDTVRAEHLLDPLDPSTKYVLTSLQLSDVGGWTVGARYSITFQDITSDYDWLLPPPDDPEYNQLTQHRWTKVVLTSPDGATHELRPIDYVAYTDGFQRHNYLRGYYGDNPNSVNGPLRYYSFDGSHLWAKIDPNPYADPSNPSMGRVYGAAQSWTLYLPNGTRIDQSGGVQRITDTNANKIKIWTDAAGAVTTAHYQDEQTGREIKYVYDSSGNGGLGLGQVQYQTVGGVWEAIDVNFGTTRVQGKLYYPGDPVCADAGLVLDTQITVLRSIVFPQTEPGQPRKQFTFAYNSDVTDAVNQQWRPNCNVGYQTITTASHGWGSLNQLVTPQGATANYTYSHDGEVFLTNPDDAPRESLTSKTLIHDGTSDTWLYSTTPATGGFTGPDGSSVTETRYSSDPGFAHTYSGFGGKEELVYRTNNSNKVMVERHWTLMNFGGENIAPGGNVLVAFNPVADAEYTTLLDDTPSHNPMKMSAKTLQYDYNGDLLSETDYDWFPDLSQVQRDAQGVPTGVPAGATVLRVINNSYYNPATTSTSGNVYAKRSLSTATPLILNAPQQTTLGPSIAQFSYDGQAYGNAPTLGNLTSKSVWDDLDNKWITSSLTYGLYGNLATTTDARGKVTQFFYDDSTHALPNRVVVDPQNGTGTQTTTTAFDYYTGLVTSTTDANGNTLTVDYTNQLLGTVDPFGRPGVTIGPLVNVGGVNQHHRTTTTYEDHLLRVTVAADLNAENDKLLKTRTTTDTLGRAVLSEQSEDGTSYTIYSRKAYDQMGKITYASSLMRYNTSASTDAWTRMTNDNAGRVTEVATFGSATQPPATGTSGIWTGSVTTNYDANTVTVIDQAGKQRKSVSDALGRLVQVYEAPNDSNYNYQTSYDYDGFGNLRHVYQGTQTRTFTYDSLSRLRTAANPESGTITYSYDDNGNLTQTTDARPVTTNYVYDALNRPTSRAYSDSTPAVTYSYDAGSGVSNPKGRLISVSSSVSTYSYSGYDALGRVSGGTQTLGSQSYSLSYIYDLAGHVKSMTYPSERTVTNAYDGAGRLNSFTGNLGDGVARTYATGVSYDAGSRMTQEQFGTNTAVYNKLFYNSRGQLSEIRDSTTPNDTSWNRGAIINHYSDNCWGMCSGASMPDNNGNLKNQDVYIPDQVSSYVTWRDHFDYDSLNRLQRVREYADGTHDWQQEYVYDRWGNRTINQANTWGGVNNQLFTVDTNTNRLTVPNGYSGTMAYDSAGNLTNDTYSGQGQRIYDAENRMTQAWANGQWQVYSYDGDGRRARRKVNGVETWQVYGIGGELMAEYAPNAPASTPDKEYGYRNGQLLVTASAVDLALGKTATQSSTFYIMYASLAVDGNTNGDFWGGMTSATADYGYQDWWQVDLGSSQSIGKIQVWPRTDCCPEHTANFYVLVSDNPFTSTDLNTTLNQSGVSNYWVAGNNATTAIVNVNRTGRYVRVQRNDSQYLVLAEVKVLASTADVNWLVTDQLGTPRMIFDKTGSLANTKRHDYLPFGEELFATQGLRSGTMGYVTDNVRQKFTQKERDNETGLDYFGARYYASTQGRFTSPDEPLIGQDEPDPQTWNLYSHTSNNPVNRVDGDGKRWFYRKADKGWEVQWVNPNEDGSYCPPAGDGWQEFVPKDKYDNLVFYSSDGYHAYYFGETSDGSPRAFSFWTGKVENKPDHILAATFIFQDIINLARASFTALQVARIAATEEIKTVATEAGATTLEQQVVKAAAGKITGFTKHGINQAISRDGVGVASRAILDAVSNPIKVIAGRASTKYIGRDATVVLNKAGKVITTWARNSAGKRIGG